MKRSLLIVGFVAVLILSACGAASMSRAPAATQAPAATMMSPALEMPGRGGGAPVPQEALAPPSDSAKTAAQNVTGIAQNNSSQANANRLVIQNANLSIVVKDVEARSTAIQNMAKNMGGYVVSVNIGQTHARNGTQVPQAQVTIRVPAEKLDDALAQIKQGTVDVQNETRSGQDVTDQYVDLQSRLKAKQAAEEQLTKIMENATKTQDVLDVYGQLQQVESDIEVLKGQIKYYEQSAALSAINVTIVAEETIKPIEVAGWKPQGVARDALQSLIYFWQGFVDFLIRFFLFTLPMLITIGLPLYVVFLLVRWVVRKTRKPKKKTAIEESTK